MLRSSLLSHRCLDGCIRSGLIIPPRILSIDVLHCVIFLISTTDIILLNTVGVELLLRVIVVSVELLHGVSVVVGVELFPGVVVGVELCPGVVVGVVDLLLVKPCLMTLIPTILRKM